MARSAGWLDLVPHKLRETPCSLLVQCFSSGLSRFLPWRYDERQVSQQGRRGDGARWLVAMMRLMPLPQLFGHGHSLGVAPPAGLPVVLSAGGAASLVRYSRCAAGDT